MENVTSQEQGFIRHADALLSVLPSGREKEILEGGPEGFRPYLTGTPMEALLAPGNDRFFGSVIGVAMSRIKEKKERG
ncbi:MAG: hypothetical protein M1537_01860 [Nitrospirae bacterium]|nr:hypothetical protein [Nitrospirota bacterium]MCL5284214.1 hypothetical protein [Nitrospirota bacterium]